VTAKLLNRLLRHFFLLKYAKSSLFKTNILSTDEEIQVITPAGKSDLQVVTSKPDPVWYRKQDVSFTQTYDITNAGPSPTNETITIKIYYPEITEFLKAKFTFKYVGKINCKDGSGKPKEYFDFGVPSPKSKYVIDCTTVKCKVKICDIKPNFKKNEKVSITLTAEFNVEQAKKLKSKKTQEGFAILTYLEYNYQNKKKPISKF